MPRNPRHTNSQLRQYHELRNLSLAISVREKQVKLRRLEWDTQTLALPHITPLPGDGKLQVRKPLTQDDMPRPRTPMKMPEYKPGMPHGIYQGMLDLYLDDRRDAARRDPYNKLASVTAQAILEAAQAREDARQEKIRDSERRAREKREQEKKD